MKKIKIQSGILNLDICTLSGYRQDNVMVSRLATYLKEHQNLIFPHRHNFYHLVFFTQGRGSHTIDFDHFQIEPFQVYFMIPGQVHTWDFEGQMDGFVVNFSESFFYSFLLKQDYLDSFSFFRGNTRDSVINLSSESGNTILNLFENILREVKPGILFQEDLSRLMLLQIFIHTEKTASIRHRESKRNTNNAVIRNFQLLVGKNLKTLRLPGEYAELLNVTPNHLNALSKEHLGRQAGEVIRDRIVLEAKRLLVSLDLTVSEIAYQLNFNDNSYFTKFFKKTTGLTPEEFRKRSVSERNDQKFS